MRVYTTNQNRGSCLCKGAVLERERERESLRKGENLVKRWRSINRFKNRDSAG